MMRPPVCNTGVHLHPPQVSGFAQECRFDWYRATVPAHVELILSAVLRLTEGTPDIYEGRGRFNYRHSLTVSSGGDRVATILHGGSNGHPNVEASGERSPALAQLLRKHGPHRVTRLDVCRDLYGEDVFSRMEQVALDVAKSFGLDYDKSAKPLHQWKGEIIRLGSRTSAVYARIYEKGKRDRALYGGVPAETLSPWVRCELEVKPQKDMKLVASTMPPEAFWGCSDWTAVFAKEAFAFSAEPIDFHPRRTASDDRAFAFMCKQYRNLLRRRVDGRHCGDRLLLGQEILGKVYDEDEDTDW